MAKSSRKLAQVAAIFPAVKKKINTDTGYMPINRRHDILSRYDEANGKLRTATGAEKDALIATKSRMAKAAKYYNEGSRTLSEATNMKSPMGMVKGTLKEIPNTVKKLIGKK